MHAGCIGGAGRVEVVEDWVWVKRTAITASSDRFSLLMFARTCSKLCKVSNGFFFRFFPHTSAVGVQSIPVSSSQVVKCPGCDGRLTCSPSPPPPARSLGGREGWDGEEETERTMAISPISSSRCCSKKVFSRVPATEVGRCCDVIFSFLLFFFPSSVSVWQCSVRVVRNKSVGELHSYLRRDAQTGTDEFPPHPGPDPTRGRQTAPP